MKEYSVGNRTRVVACPGVALGPKIVDAEQRLFVNLLTRAFDAQDDPKHGGEKTACRYCSQTSQR